MQQALLLVRRALGETAPNPAVGAVIVRDGERLGGGWTQPPGGHHAEIEALAACRAAGHDPAGATLYTTLEPCCHHGRTAPCTDALVAAGIQRVVVGAVDPFERVRGQGMDQLRKAGVDVVSGVEQLACERMILGFARAVTQGLPQVTCKAGVSADGHIATASGESQWITGEGARAAGQLLRAEHDAILVGMGTALADDPRLTCRLADRTSPVPVVLDTWLRLPADARMLQGPMRAIVFCGPDAEPRDLPADIVRVPLRDGRVDAEAALREVAGRGLHRVLVEGGGEVHRSLLDAGLVDTVELFVSGKIIPGGHSWVGGKPLGRLADAPQMTLWSSTAVPPDVRLTYRVEHRFPPAVR